ncbi:hypothetical protein M8J76_009446 [Diaphorina citri]|nr:hypothetical protein M8J76_009446 [Diaphorina citri]
MVEKHRDSHISWLSQSIYNVDGSDPPQCPPPQTIFLPRSGHELLAFTMAGIPISHNCSKTLSAFGLIFMLIGIVLTITAYRGGMYENKLKTNGAPVDKSKTEESKILGPACVVIAIAMWTLSLVLWYLMKKSRDKEGARIAFHCPLHGDFFPLILEEGKHHRRRREILSCFPCWTRSGPEDQKDNLTLELSPDEVVQCPHSTSRYSSNRSSLANVPATEVSPCPTPVPFLVTTPSPSTLVQASSTGSILLEPYGSIKSLSASHDVACFPVEPYSPAPSPNLQRKSLPSSPLLTSSRFRTLSLDVSNLPTPAPPGTGPISYHNLSPIQSSRGVTPRQLSAPSHVTLSAPRVMTPEIMYVTPIHPLEEEEERERSLSAKY